ncbi:MAG: hypothetical protein ACEQSR_03020 [Candidatus Methylacidiphilales bacterium]
MKAINKKILPIFFIIFMVGCEKDKPNTVITEDPNKYKVFDVHVQKLSDKSPMQDYNLSFSKTTWNQSGRSYKDSNMYFTKTNSEGNASFKILKQLIIDSSHIFYYIGSYIFDSTYNGRYNGGIEVYHTKKNSNNLIEVEPACFITISTKPDDWTTYDIDSIKITNKNYYPLDLYNKDQSFYIRADCMETNTIKYFYYSNGVRSKEYTKDIYIPYSSRGLDIVICTLDFK